MELVEIAKMLAILKDAIGPDAAFMATLMGLMFIQQRTDKRVMNAKIDKCSRQHGRCQKHTSILLRLAHGMLMIEEHDLDPRRSGVRRVEDLQRIETLMKHKQELHKVIAQMDRDEEEEAAEERANKR